MSEASRLLFQGLAAALADINPGPSDDLTSVLIHQQGIALAQPKQFESAGESRDAHPPWYQADARLHVRTTVTFLNSACIRQP